MKNPILVGHSDGASIALIHAGAGHAVRGVVAMAPHVFIEPLCLSSIEQGRATRSRTPTLPQKLGRYHRDARKTFYGWADVWLDPEFKGWDIRDDYLPGVRCPVLAIQGHDDEYGTMAQLDEIERARERAVRAAQARGLRPRAVQGPARRRCFPREPLLSWRN